MDRRTPRGKRDVFADVAQERLHHLVPAAAGIRELPPGLGQEHAAVGALRDEPIARQALQHLGDGRLRHAEARRNVHLPRLAAIADQIVDQLDVILDQLGAPGLAGLAKALHVALGIDQDGLGRALLGRLPSRWGRCSTATSMSGIRIANGLLVDRPHDDARPDR